jgi:hypothetical protein
MQGLTLAAASASVRSQSPLVSAAPSGRERIVGVPAATAIELKKLRRVRVIDAVLSFGIACH